MTIKNHKIKDDLLRYLEKQGETETDIRAYASTVGLDYYIMRCFTEELIGDSLVTARHAKASDLDEVYVKIDYPGRFFLNQLGGYTKDHKIESNNEKYTIAKTIMTAISAAAIIFISVLNYMATDKANDNKTEFDKLNSVIIKQASSIDSLNKCCQTHKKISLLRPHKQAADISLTV